MARARPNRPTTTSRASEPITHYTIMSSILLEFFIFLFFIFPGKANGVHTGAAFCSDQRTNRLQVLQRNGFDTPGFMIERPNQQHC